MVIGTIIKTMIDIGVVTFLIYQTIMMVKGTRAIEILKGVAIIVGVWLVSSYFDLQTLKFLSSQVLVYGLLGLLILFQPEVRMALERLGKNNLRSRGISKSAEVDKLINNLVEASEYLSKRHIGALISLEMEDSLKEYIKTGIGLNAKVSKELLINIFTPNVPLHDGALIISEGRLESASCYLPLSQSEAISKELGTRHRAAIGLSEVTDALTIVVSEETGAISISKNGHLIRGMTPEELKSHLGMFLITPDKKQTKKKSKGVAKDDEK